MWAASGHCTQGSCSFFWAKYRRARSRAQNHTEELRGVSRRRNCEAFLRALPSAKWANATKTVQNPLRIIPKDRFDVFCRKATAAMWASASQCRTALAMTGLQPDRRLHIYATTFGFVAVSPPLPGRSTPNATFITAAGAVGRPRRAATIHWLPWTIHRRAKIRKQLIKVLPLPIWQRDCFHTAAHIAARPHSALAIAASFRDTRWQVAEAGKPLGQRSRCAASGHMDGLEAPIHRIFGPEWKERIAEPQAFIIFVAATAKPTRGETAVAVPHRCGARGEVHRGQGGGCGTDENENAGEGSEPPDPPRQPPARRPESDGAYRIGKGAKGRETRQAGRETAAPPLGVPAAAAAAPGEPERENFFVSLEAPHGPPPARPVSAASTPGGPPPARPIGWTSAPKQRFGSLATATWSPTRDHRQRVQSMSDPLHQLPTEEKWRQTPHSHLDGF